MKSGWPRAVLFDLDGTLIDSAPDITAAVNELLARSGRGPLTVADVTAMIGNGVEKLVERALNATGDPLTPQALEREQAAMLDIYGRHLTGLTTLLPGVPEALETLRRDGIRLGLATNKQQRFIETIFEHFGLSPLFDAVIGGGPGIVKKPAPDMLTMAMHQLGVTPSDTVMVGDSTSDVQAARAAGTRSVIVRGGGYTRVPAEQLGADIVIADMTGLAAALESLDQRGP